LASTLVASGAVAHAQQTARPRVRFVLDPCIPVDPTETARLAAMELHADAVDAGDVTTSVLTHCDGDRVVLRVEDGATRKTIERAVRRSDLAQRGASRLLALAISELVFASWAELNEEPPPLEPADPAPPAPSVDAVRDALDARERSSAAPSASPPPHGTGSTNRVSASEPFVRARFALGLLARVFPAAAGAPMWLGARIDAGVTLGELGLVTLALGFSGASSRADIGRIDGWLPEAALLGGVRAASTRVEFRALIGVHAGVALFRGIAATPILTSERTVAGAWFGPALEVGLSWRANRHLALFGMFDAGYSLAGITARTRIIETTGIDHSASPELGATGPWITVGIGAAFRP
jgi:hypothetical protein